jgi:heme exporter protein A
VRILSRGMKQRASIARALVHRPALLILDEPHTGLDAQARDLLDDLLRERLAEGAAVVMATHDLARVRALCSRVLVLSEGRLSSDLPANAVGEVEPREPPATPGVRAT